VICGIIDVNVKFTGDDEFMRSGSSERRVRINRREKWRMI